MGVAQDMPILIDLAETFKVMMKLDFYLLGEEQWFQSLKKLSNDKNLKIFFFDEIDPNEILSS